MQQRTMSDPDYVELIAALRRLREERGLAQAALAQLLGRPQSFVAKYETCERRLDVLDLLRICRALGARIQDVIPRQWRDEL
jgi:transcriptional regulator with XRE-family HTH domain